MLFQSFTTKKADNTIDNKNVFFYKYTMRILITQQKKLFLQQ